MAIVSCIGCNDGGGHWIDFKWPIIFEEKGVENWVAFTWLSYLIQWNLLSIDNGQQKQLVFI